MLVKELSAIFEIIFDPKKVFKRAIEFKKYWIPMAVIIIVMSIFVPFTSKIQHADRVKFIEDNPKIQETIPEDRMEEIKTYNPKKDITRNLIGIIVLIPITLAVLSLLFYLGSMLAGIETSFVQILTLTSYAKYVDVLWGGILKNILGLSQGSFMNISTSFALFAPNIKTTSMSFRILNLFDFFNIWFYILIAIGISMLPKANTNKTGIISAAIFTLKTLVFLGLIILTKSFMGG